MLTLRRDVGTGMARGAALTALVTLAGAFPPSGAEAGDLPSWMSEPVERDRHTTLLARFDDPQSVQPEYERDGTGAARPQLRRLGPRQARQRNRDRRPRRPAQLSQSRQPAPAGRHGPVLDPQQAG